MGDRFKLYDQFEKWREKGVIWLIGDTHFNDGENELYGWPTDEERIKMINAKVGKNDALIILGDVGDVEYAKKLKGYKVLITGNHDKGASNYKVNYWTEIYDADDKCWYKCVKGNYKDYPHTSGRIVEQGKFVRLVSDSLFEEVYEGPLFISNKVLLSHEPIDLKFGINIHGHCHSATNMVDYVKDLRASVNLASDVCGFTPYRLDDLVKTYKTSTIHRLTIDKRSS